MKKSKLLSIFLVAIMIVTLLPVSSLLGSNAGTVQAATSHTQDEAINWVKSKIGKTVDYDGAYGGQCADLIFAYYNYLGVKPVMGNGADFATNKLPSGWTRYSADKCKPQKGDILVWTGGTSNYGHVAIYESDDGLSFNDNWPSFSCLYEQTFPIHQYII